MGAVMPEIVKTLSFDETEIKFTGDGKQGIFEGYASVFNNTDSDGDIILPGAFKNALANQTRKVAMFFNHKTWELPVGKWDSLAEDKKACMCAVNLPRAQRRRRPESGNAARYG
jgi:phage head maturation protease